VQWQKIRWNGEREYFGIPSAAFHHFCQSSMEPRAVLVA
jgi:hypothetical protein